jgi:phytoene dehydrogenase-like protein
MRDLDAIIIGGSHNGLTCAAYLAMAGLRVRVFEWRGVVGGACVTEEFHPGFRNSTASYTVSLLQPKVIDDLKFARACAAPRRALGAEFSAAAGRALSAQRRRPHRGANGETSALTMRCVIPPTRRKSARATPRHDAICGISIRSLWRFRL